MEKLTEAERAALAAVAGRIIPASDAHGVPGADDPAIIAGIAASADRQSGDVRAALAAWSAAADDDAFRRDAPAAALLQTIVATSYYRDPRVLASLGAPARAPFPQGYEVEAGDWSLLDPVRARGPVWRPVDGEEAD